MGNDSLARAKDFARRAGRFYWRCIKRAFPTAWQWAGLASGVLGLFIPAYLKSRPQHAALVNDLLWQIPLGILIVYASVRLLLSPFLEWESDVLAHEARMKTLREEHETRLRQLGDRELKRDIELETLRQKFIPRLDLHVSTPSRMMGDEDVQIETYIVNRSRDNRVALRFALKLVFHESDSVLVLHRERLNRGVETSLGPQEHTHGVLTFTLAAPGAGGPLREHDTYLIISDGVTGTRYDHLVEIASGKANV